MDGGAAKAGITANSLVPAGSFSHVVGTFDPATQALRIFVNGVSLPVSLYADTPVPVIHRGTAPIRLGAYVRGDGQLEPSWMFAGLIDEVSLYDHALTADEVQALYNASSTGKCKAPDTNAPTVLAVSPEFGRLAYPTNTTFVLTFNETMDEATVTNGNVFITDAVGNLVESTVIYHLATRTAVIIRAAGLLPGTNTLTVSTGVKDLAGNGLAVAFRKELPVSLNAMFVSTDTLVAADDLNYDGMDLIVNACVVTLQGSHRFHGVAVINHGRLFVAGGTALTAATDLLLKGGSQVICQGMNGGNLVDGQWLGTGVQIYAAQVAVETGSRISADGEGYSTGMGPGAGVSSYWASGAGHGGQGGIAASSLLGGGEYGSLFEPVDLGSGGAQGDSGWGWCPGGGAIRLTVTNTLWLDGEISANAAPSPTWNCSGGSGGSISLRVGDLRGMGSFTANGGAGNGAAGGGGGGRVAIYSASAYTFAGTMSASGAYHGGWGGWGTSRPPPVLADRWSISIPRRRVATSTSWERTRSLG